jgi:glycosyltransferase involved in cell wall biosynthesis
VSPDVTVVIPTYNRRDIIGPTIAGALSQEGVDLEVVVVDDCSTDGTAERLRYVDDPRLRVLRNPGNLRQAASRNRGIAAARGSWVAFLDDDDLWSPQKIRDQLDAAERAGADLAYSTAVVLNEHLEPIQVFYPPLPDEQPRSILQSSSVPACASNALVRTARLREIGGLDERFDALADWNLFIRLMLSGPPAVLKEPHVGYVLRPASISAALLERHFTDFDLIEREFRAARHEHGAELNGLQFSRWLAGGLRRGGRRGDAIRAYLRGAWRYRSIGNLFRALGVSLGEGAMGRARRSPELPPWADPDWLDLYRPGGKLAKSLDDLTSPRLTLDQ